jgi:hypothetical protein
MSSTPSFIPTSADVERYKRLRKLAISVYQCFYQW